MCVVVHEPVHCSRVTPYTRHPVNVTVLCPDLLLSEPGSCCGNEDSRRNKNRKLLNKLFSVGKKIDKRTLFSIKIRMIDL